jgi:hypothetical protein
MVAMVDPCDLPRLLRQISRPLLRDFFAHHGVLRDLPWNSLSPTYIEPVLIAWQQLPASRRSEIEVALRDIHCLADSRGMRLFADEIQRKCPHRATEFLAHNGHLNKAVWAYLKLPEAFGLAAPFARMDALSNGCGWIKRTGLPRGRVKIDKCLLDGLEEALSKYYWSTELRGRRCQVEYSDRASGSQCFTAYLEDLPDNRLAFASDHEVLPCCRECAFWTVFLFNPNEGSLELIARDGGAACLPLQQAFCRSVLGIDVGPVDPLRPAYRLGMLLEPSFTCVTDPADHIAQVFLRCIRLETIISPGPWEYQELKFQTQTDLLAAVETIQGGLALNKLRPAQVLVREAAFHLLFLPNAEGCTEEMTLDVTVPDVCSLKSNPDDLWAAGEHCLTLWGIACV